MLQTTETVVCYKPNPMSDDNFNKAPLIDVVVKARDIHED